MIDSSFVGRSFPVCRTFDGKPVTAHLSTALRDEAWDEFLRSGPLGHYQQSGMWAQAKRPEGWRPVRVVATKEGRIAGGFQILWKSSGSVRIGYVSKGPVAQPENPSVLAFLLDLIKTTSKEQRLSAVIIQPPDLSECLPGQMSDASSFQKDVLLRVIDATLIVALEGSFEDAWRAVQARTRRKVRQALRDGVTVRDAGRDDIPTFFRLMQSTCKRQGVKPHPSREAPLYALWDAASDTAPVKLFIAEYEGRAVAGLLCVPFGKMVVLWKKGWASTTGELHPNDLLTYEAMKWAHSNGYGTLDFASLDRKIAEALLEGRALSELQRESRHFFNLHFGGRPRLLPASRIYFPNRLLRSLYSLLCLKLSLHRCMGPLF